MRDFFLWLFSENSTGGSISLYSFWHIFYLVLIFGGSIALAFIFKNKSQVAKNRVITVFAYLTIICYIADFFIMPLSDSYNGISVWKLPFNICTLVGVWVPFVHFNPKFKKVKGVVVMLAIASSMMWMVYPGSALGGEPPFSYLIFQTFIYHGYLFAWGFLSATLGEEKLHIKNCWKDLLGILVVLVWAWIGNMIYDQDWFFIMGKTFPILPAWAMPILVVALVFVVCLAVYGINHLVLLIASKCKKNRGVEAQVAEEPKIEQ